MNPSPWEWEGLKSTHEITSVWATGQKQSRAQRNGRYVPEAMRHPAKMLPAIAAMVIGTYSRPGELVVDPMCGIGTTLVEAVHLGRRAVGVEFEERWAKVAVAGLALAERQGATGPGRVISGDARAIGRLLAELARRVALVLTSPPYGAMTHGHVRSTRDSGKAGIRKWNHRYSRDRANLAHRSLPDLLEGFGRILEGCGELLRPGGAVAVTVRPYRLHGELVDLPGCVLEVGQASGLEFADRIACLLCGVGERRLLNRSSFFQLHEARRGWARGLPIHAIAHEDLLIFRKPADGPLVEGATPRVTSSGTADDKRIRA
ncbi:TRM11 family SAM-dependent methyltransferase [Sinosporangium siamense]|uniref:TRM11 family SAM-dependent methyltransferase n=1 Tax=Sinosporangium siamense TaxID=1367973 RepID=UPI0023B25F70